MEKIEMTDRPIIFSAPMVRALLAGRKTQTRRLVSPQPVRSANGRWWDWTQKGGGGAHADDVDNFKRMLVPFMRYAIGDRLYVREHWRTSASLDHLSPKKIGDAALEAGYERPWAPMLYIADGTNHLRGYADEAVGKHRQAMHMPRWASRLTLIVEAVRVERLHDISRDDAIAEGLTLASDVIEQFWRWPEPHHENLWLSPPAAYRHLWESLHGPDSWDENPWVVALTFRVVPGNIDRIVA